VTTDNKDESDDLIDLCGNILFSLPSSVKKEYESLFLQDKLGKKKKLAYQFSSYNCYTLVFTSNNTRVFLIPYVILM
jgi:hypothetical protein